MSSFTPLFNLVFKVPSVLINQFQSKALLYGFPIYGLNDSITVLQFIDDTILFLHRINDVASRVHRCLEIFSMVSGLSINLHKSTIIGIEKDSIDTLDVVIELHCRFGSLPLKYLGFHIGGKIFNCKSWDCIVDVFKSSLSECNARHFSMGGR